MVDKAFTSGPSRLMSSVLDVGYNPSGSTPEKQLQSWNEQKSKANFDRVETSQRRNSPVFIGHRSTEMSPHRMATQAFKQVENSH